MIIFTCPTNSNSAGRPQGKSTSSQVLSKLYLYATCHSCLPKPKSHGTRSYLYNLCFSESHQEQLFVRCLQVVPQSSMSQQQDCVPLDLRIIWERNTAKKYTCVSRRICVCWTSLCPAKRVYVKIRENKGGSRKDAVNIPLPP